MKKLSKTLFLFFLSLNMLGVPFGFPVIQSQNLTSVEAKAKNLGSAKKLKGNTIIISIFTNDKQTKWNIKKKEDTTYMSNTLKDLRIATTWISTKAISIVEPVIPPCVYSQIAKHNAIASPSSIIAVTSMISHQSLSSPLKNLVRFS